MYVARTELKLTVNVPESDPTKHLPFAVHAAESEAGAGRRRGGSGRVESRRREEGDGLGGGVDGEFLDAAFEAFHVERGLLRDALRRPLMTRSATLSFCVARLTLSSCSFMIAAALAKHLSTAAFFSSRSFKLVFFVLTFVLWGMATVCLAVGLMAAHCCQDDVGRERDKAR